MQLIPSTTKVSCSAIDGDLFLLVKRLCFTRCNFTGQLSRLCHPAVVSIGRQLWGWAGIDAPSGGGRIVGISTVVGVEKLFKPLNELKVVLETALYQSVDGHDLKWSGLGHGYWSVLWMSCLACKRRGCEEAWYRRSPVRQKKLMQILSLSL